MNVVCGAAALTPVQARCSRSQAPVRSVRAAPRCVATPQRSSSHVFAAGPVVSAPRRLRRAAERRIVSAKAQKEPEPSKVTPPAEFGYTRKDVLIISGGVLVGGYALYNGLIASGVDPLWAGNVIQLVFVLGLMVAWTGSYVFRVFTKQMTYAKQLDAYEEAVMRKRLEELPESELGKLMDEVETEKQKREAAGKQRPGPRS